MKSITEEDGGDWLAVIGRSLAFLCFKQSGVESEDMGAQGRFLIGLGLSRADAAAILGTTDNSLRVTLGKKKKKGSARGRKR